MSGFTGNLIGSLVGTAVVWWLAFLWIRRDIRYYIRRRLECPPELRIVEDVTEGEDPNDIHRIEYAYGAINPGNWMDNDINGSDLRPILLRTSDFWMPISRATEIRDWLTRAIEYTESRR